MTARPPQPPDHSPLSGTLPDLEQRTWQQLAAVLTDAKDPSTPDGFKTLVVATCTSNGADARMVVLRKVDTDHKYVWFHADARSAKIMQLEAFPKASLLFWDAEQQCQLRLTVETRLHTDDYVADEHWESLWTGGRKSYLSEYQPGKVMPAPYPGFPEALGEDLPSDEASEKGRKNFAVIECRVLSLEYLHLSRSGQTRARFQYEPERSLAWLAP